MLKPLSNLSFNNRGGSTAAAIFKMERFVIIFNCLDMPLNKISSHDLFFIKLYQYCVKSVRIRSYSRPHFSHIFPFSDWMRENAGKMRTRITPNTDTFYA